MKWPWSKKLEPVKNVGEISEEEAIRFFQELNGIASIAGPVVNESTAMKVSAVYGCVGLLAETMASIPCEIHEKKADGDEVATGHDAFALLHDQPNPMMTAFTFWEGMGYYNLLPGNAYALIGRKGARLASLSLLPSARVFPKFSPDFTRILYRVALKNGEYVTFDQDDILHIPCIGWDGLKGMSPLSAARESIGLDIASTEHSSRFFSNGARPDGLIKFEKKLSKDQAELIRDYWHRKHQGLDKSHLPAILTEGGDYKQTTMSAQDSQLVESRQFGVEDICRFFGRIPPHMICHTTKSTSFGKGLEELSLGFIKYSLRPFLKRFEQEINRKILRPPYYCKFNLEGLLRGDTKTRADFYKVMLGGNQIPGVMSVNEIRKLEKLKPKDGKEYDEPYRPNQGEQSDETPPTPVKPER